MKAQKAVCRRGRLVCYYTKKTLPGEEMKRVKFRDGVAEVKITVLQYIDPLLTNLMLEDGENFVSRCSGGVSCKDF